VMTSLEVSRRSSGEETEDWMWAPWGPVVRSEWHSPTLEAGYESAHMRINVIQPVSKLGEFVYIMMVT
jgi:hypothetical protein